MKQSLWTQHYSVNTFLLTPQKRLGLYGLLNLFQDTAWIHATHLGHGHEAMLKEGTAWILTRQKMQMDQWPHWGDEIKLNTWIRPIKGPLAIRDFEIFSHDKKIGECTTQWLMMNLSTRKPADKTLSLPSEEVKSYGHVSLEASRIQLQSSLKEFAQFHVRNSDLDMNGHVNNTRYAQWVLDSISVDTHQHYVLKEYEVNFIAETKLGDVITVFGGKIDDDKFQFQGLRSSDQKVVFAATMKV
jgi:medium-chain acyl-[acyl-carrier-protein] hydrolase